MTDKSDKQAYLLMAHSNLEQLNFLIRSLDSEFSDIFLHLDAKSKINPDEIVRPVSSQLISVIESMYIGRNTVKCNVS